MEDMLDSDSYAKALKPKKDDPCPKALAARRKQLDAIASDPTISYSDRQDAKRISETAELTPRAFAIDFSELIARLKKDCTFGQNIVTTPRGVPASG